MKRIFAMALAIIGIGSAVMANAAGTAPHTLEFDGVTYVLRSVDVSGQTVTNEYVPKGQTLDNWTTLIGVREFRGTPELKDVLPSYVAMIRPLLYVKPVFLARKGVDTTREIMLQLWLKDPGNRYLEYDLHRFMSRPGGTLAYQFAQRVVFRKPLDVTPVMKRQVSRIQELDNATFPVYEHQ